MLNLTRRPLAGLRILIATALVASMVVAVPAVAMINSQAAVLSVEPDPSPFQGSVEESGAVSDVYRFAVREGQTLHVDVEQESDATATASLFGPGTTDPEYFGSELASQTLDATSTTFSHSVTRHETGIGQYFLNVAAISGDSTYTVNWSLDTPEIQLDRNSEPLITMLKGSTRPDITFTADWKKLGSEPVTFTTETNDTWLEALPATGTATTSVSQQITLKLGKASTLAPGSYVETATVSVPGATPQPFRVSLHVLDKPKMTLASTPSKVKYGGTATLTGTITDSNGAAMKNQTVTLYRSYSGTGGWTVVRSFKTTTGGYSFATPVYRHTYFRVGFSGAGDYAQAESNRRLIYAYAYVQRPYVPKHIRPAKTYTFKGSLKPQHAQGTYAIRLYWQYYARGKWRSESSMAVPVSNYSNYSIYKYRDRYGRGVARKWRVRAMHSDSSHLKTYSSWRYYSVY